MPFDPAEDLRQAAIAKYQELRIGVALALIDHPVLIAGALFALGFGAGVLFTY